MRRRGVKSQDEEQKERLRILTESDLERHFFEENVEGIKQHSSKSKIALRRFVPVSIWFPEYQRSKFLRDLTLGLTLAFVIAPKAMAHALLANVNPEHGIYTALSASFTYGILGTCSLLSVGTCALPALLFGEALIASGLEDYETGISTLTFMTGLITLIMAIFRLERLTSFIPPCALSAFTTTAAFLIGTSQVKYMLGLHFKADGFVQTWIAVFRNIHDVNVPTLLISLTGVLFLKSCKKAVRKWGGGSIPDPSAIVLVLSTTLISFLCDLESSGVDVVGVAPTGISVSAPNLHLVPRFASSAFTIAVINYVLSTSIAKSMASKSETAKFDSAQELRALSGVNLIGSFFGSFVAGGSFSGSAIIASMNGDSMMHNFVNAAAMFVVIMLLLPLLASLPKAVRVVRAYGMMVAIVASILALVRRASKASTVVELGRLRGTVIYRRFDMFPDSRRLMCRREHGTFYPLRIYRLDSAIHFGNTEQIEYVGVFFVVLVEYFERRFEYFERRFEYFEITITSTLEHTKHRYDLVRALQQISTVDSIEMSESFQQEDSKQRETEEKKVQEEENEDIVRGVIVLSCVAVNYLDTAGISMLRRFAESCEKENVRLYFSGWKANCRATLYRYAREIELREKTGPTTSANAPERAIDRLTNKRDQAATIPVRSNMERKRKIISSPLNPNRWFLALHDAVLQMNAVETISSRGGDAGESVDKSHAWRFTGHIARAFVTPTGNLVGRTPREVDFRNKYNSVIIRIFRGGNALPVSRIGRVVLRADDELVLDINNSFDRDGKNLKRDLRVELTHDTGGKLSLNTEAVNMLIAAHVESAPSHTTTRTIVDQTVEDAGLRGLPGLFLVAIERIDRTILHAVSPKEIIQSGDVLWFAIISKDNSSASRVKAAEILNGIVGLRMSEQKQKDDVSNKIFDRFRRSAAAEIDPTTRKEVHEHSIMINLK